MSILQSIGTSSWARGFKPVHCGSDSCGRWLTHRQLSVRRVGVTFGGTWYCGYRCFRAVAEQRLERLFSAVPSTQRRPERQPLGLGLLRQGLLNEVQFKEVLKIERETANGQGSEELGEIVVRLGMLTEKQVTAVRAQQWNCPIFPFTAATVRTAVRIPCGLMQRYSMAPLHHAGNRLFVGFAYAIEYEALFAVQQIVGCTVQPCFITPSEFRQLVPAHLPLNELNVSDADGSAEMANTLCSYGASIDADEIALVRCAEFVWARLKSGTKIADILFNSSSFIQLPFMLN